MANTSRLSAEERLLRALRALCAEAEESLANEGALVGAPALNPRSAQLAPQSAASQNNSVGSPRAGGPYSHEAGYVSGPRACK